jgi:quinol monooxygenase YgiN
MADTATQTGTVTKGLLVRIEANPGREADVEAFLESGLDIVRSEPATTAWFAIKLGPSTYGIFDVFPDEAGRDAHLGGQVATALMDKVGELYGEPTLEKLARPAAKLPGA